MSDLIALAQHARNAPPVVIGLPIETIQRRADARRRFKRSVGGSIGVAVLAAVILVTSIGVGRQRAGITSTITSAGSTTEAPPPSDDTTPTTAPGGTFTPTPELPGLLQTVPASPIPTAPPPSTAPPLPAGLDAHGLSTDGPRPLKFGATLADAEAVTGKRAVSSGGQLCGPSPMTIKDALPGVDLVFTDGNTLHFVDVRGRGLTTISGIGVGTPISALVQRVPSVERNQLGASVVYTAYSAGKASSISFWSDDDVTVGSMLAGSGDTAFVQEVC